MIFRSASGPPAPRMTREQLLEMMTRPAPPKPAPKPRPERPWTLEDVFGRRPARPKPPLL